MESVIVMVGIGLFAALAVAGAGFAVVRIRRLTTALAQKSGDLDRTSKLLIEKNIELLDRAIRLQKMLETKSDFISIASHQLRTPLTEVKWGIEVVQDGMIPGFTPDNVVHLGKIHASIIKMIRLVNDLLQMVHAEAGYGEYRIVPCDMDAVVTKMAEKYRVMASGQGKTIRVHADAGGRAIPADREMMEIVIANLLENALWYTPSGGVIDVATAVRDKNFELRITDTGVGIPADMRESIFQKFKRSPAAITMNANGSGLGLYIVKNIVDQHGGAIGFTSDEGKGTTFYFTLPLR